jgi:G3E family GTPase
VDAVRFWDDYESGENLRERGLGGGLDEELVLSELLANQVECSTTIVLSKTDLVTDGARRRLERFLYRLNPDAAIVTAHPGTALWPRLERAAELDEARSSPTPGWMHLLTGPSLVEQETGDGTTLVYRARRPFHPFRFWTLMHQEWPGVLRSKGYFWLASQPATCYMWSQAGGSCLYERLGRWWMAIPDRDWPQESEALDELRTVWDLEFGDRRIELAFIGEDIDSAELTGRLDACLLTWEELRLDEELWRAFRDPFKKPSWEKRQTRPLRPEPRR